MCKSVPIATAGHIVTASHPVSLEIRSFGLKQVSRPWKEDERLYIRASAMSLGIVHPFYYLSSISRQLQNIYQLYPLHIVSSPAVFHRTPDTIINMSSIVNKVKEAMSSDNTHDSNSSTAHHDSNNPHTSSTANQVDPGMSPTGGHSSAPHKEFTSTDNYQYGSEQHTGGANPGITSGDTHTGSREGGYGPNSSRMANTANPRVDSDQDGSRTASTGGYSNTMPGTYDTQDREGDHGLHHSRVANAADSRVHSDRDGSRTAGDQYHPGTSSQGYGTREDEAGPRHTHAANMADPRIDSDRVGRTDHTSREGEYGPHSSSMANTADPRVDSDRDGSGMTARQHHAGTSSQGYGTMEGERGPHGSRVANAADPGVDSDRDGSRGISAGHGTGPAPNTAGPHKSDIMNKLDPRVDSNLDGSKTVGGNKTFAG